MSGLSELAVFAHAGPGSTWQAMVVVGGIVLAAAVLAGASGRLVLEHRDDLVVPLATAAILASLGTLAHDWLSDAVGWGLPLAVVALGTLLIAALTPLELRFPSPLPMGAIALAIVSMVVLHQPLTIALHPPAELLPLSDDSTIMVVEPPDGGTVDGSPVGVTVEVTGGSLGPGRVRLEDLPADPEEAGTLAVALEPVDDDAVTQQQRVEVEYHEVCTLAAPCERVSFDVVTDPGTYELTVEFVRGDGTPLAPFVRDRIRFTVP